MTSHDGTGLRFRSPERLEVVDSTNRYLVDLARSGAAEGTSVLARCQTAGRGRLGRRWVDVEGESVLCSVLFRPALDPTRWHLLSWLVALAARDACARVAGTELTLKWPNDLQVGDRKVAGLLAEVVVPPAPSGATPPAGALVVGIGVNCNWPADWPPAGDPDAAEIAARATSLDRVAGYRVDSDEVAAELLDGVAGRYSVLRGDDHYAASLAAEYRASLATISQRVRIDLADESFTGTALDVDDSGHLLVDIGACIRTVAVGDVVHVR
jgi:BirA family biotin operon repressor/biotin-[acetyl-CoA-carboxylase] ligase